MKEFLTAIEEHDGAALLLAILVVTILGMLLSTIEAFIRKK